MGVKGDSEERRSVKQLDDGLGARKRVFIPGYSGVISRMQETIAGTFAQNSRDSHYLVYHGCKPTMEAATLPSPDTFYHRRPNPRVKTNAANRSNFSLGDDRDWGFETLNELQFKVPTKIPPRHASILPCGPETNKAELDVAYTTALTKVGIAGVKRLELAIRNKIDQRTAGGPMALRKAFKFFDTDASGDIDPDEFYAAMHAFGLEFTEDQVLALFGYYDIDRDGSLSYYEFIDKVLESGFGLDDGAEKPEPVMVQLGPGRDDGEKVEMRTTLKERDISEELCKEVFDRYDVNKSGEIDVRELQQLTRSMGLSMDRESINNAMFELDRNRNGAISFEEFWTWWQDAVLSAGRATAAPRTGGSPNRAPNDQRRPRSEQSMRQGISRPGSRENNATLNDIKDIVSAEIDKARPKSRGSTGTWMSMAGRRPSSSLSQRTRPSTRNTQRSVAGHDYCPPPLLNRPPKLHGLYNLRQSLPPRPRTAPENLTSGMGSFVRFPGAPAVPNGVTSGYVL